MAAKKVSKIDKCRAIFKRSTNPVRAKMLPKFKEAMGRSAKPGHVARYWQIVRTENRA